MTGYITFSLIVSHRLQNPPSVSRLLHVSICTFWVVDSHPRPAAPMLISADLKVRRSQSVRVGVPGLASTGSGGHVHACQPGELWRAISALSLGHFSWKGD